MNHFQRLNEVKELKIFFFAQRANTQKQASSKRLLPCDALAPTAQNRQARGAWMTHQHTEDWQLYNRTFPTSQAHRGSLSKRKELVLSSLPTRPPLFSPSLGPQSLTLRVSFPCICSPPVCIICSVRHITFLGYNHMNSRASVLLDSLLSERIIRYHMCPRGRLIPGYLTRFFLQRGCCCQGKEVVPVDHIRGKGSVPVVPLGRKLVWQPVLSRAPKDPHLAV